MLPLTSLASNVSYLLAILEGTPTPLLPQDLDPVKVVSE